eukprot:1185513-Prorocentrum_minimum.AAC.2
MINNSQYNNSTRPVSGFAGGVRGDLPRVDCNRSIRTRSGPILTRDKSSMYARQCRTPGELGNPGISVGNSWRTPWRRRVGSYRLRGGLLATNRLRGERIYPQRALIAEGEGDPRKMGGELIISPTVASSLSN